MRYAAGCYFQFLPYLFYGINVGERKEFKEPYFGRGKAETAGKEIFFYSALPREFAEHLREHLIIADFRTPVGHKNKNTLAPKIIAHNEKTKGKLFRCLPRHNLRIISREYSVPPAKSEVVRLNYKAKGMIIVPEKPKLRSPVPVSKR